MTSTAQTEAQLDAAPRTAWNADALAAILDDAAGQPVLFTDATVRTMDPVIGDMTGADVLLGGSVVVGVGPGIITAAGDDGAIVVDCSGMTIVPAVVDLLALGGRRPSRSAQVATLRPGNRADLAILEDRFATSVPLAVETLMRRPQDVCAVVAEGRVLRWGGRDLEAPAGRRAPASASRTSRASSASACGSMRATSCTRS